MSKSIAGYLQNVVNECEAKKTEYERGYEIGEEENVFYESVLSVNPFIKRLEANYSYWSMEDNALIVESAIPISSKIIINFILYQHLFHIKLTNSSILDQEGIFIHNHTYWFCDNYKI